MSWNPDSGDPLASAAISVTDVEATSMAVWNEFITGWFDGNGHVIAKSYMAFPRLAGIGFQDMALPKSLEGLYLTVVASRASSAIRRFWNDTRLTVSERCRIDFYFRASVKGARADGHNSVSLARLGADRLFAVLNSPIAVKPLTFRGLGVIRPQPPIVVTGQTLPMRCLSASATYTYPAEDMATTVLVNADPRTYRFQDGNLQVWNPDTEKFHGVFVTGAPPLLAIDLEGESATDTESTAASPTFRFKGNRQLQFWNPTLSKWHSADVLGVQYPWEALDEAGEDAGDNPLAATVARTYRFKDGVGLQLYNASTGLWHTLSLSGYPPRFDLAQTGEQ